MHPVRATWGLGLALGVISLGGIQAPQAQANRLHQLLTVMRPDHHRFIREVRPAPAGLAPANVSMGLVRPGGRDPRRRTDAPRSGVGERFDLLVFDTGGFTASWTLLLLDHEYSHARHLARADDLPFPTFGDRGANHHFQEALAWGYSLGRAAQGDYGDLPDARWEEARSRYRSHRAAFDRFVRRRQPAMWTYYARLLPTDPEETPVGGVGRSERAGAEPGSVRALVENVQDDASDGR